MERIAKIEHYYQALYDIATEVNSMRTPDGVLRAMVAGVAKSLEAKACSIMLLTPDHKELLHTAAYGLSRDYVQKGVVLTAKSMAETLAGKPVAIIDATHDERVQYREAQEKEGIASILSVPIRLRGEIIGVMRVYTAEPRQFDADDIYFVDGVSDLGAILLENAQLYDTIHRDYETVRQEILQCRSQHANEWIHEEEPESAVLYRWWKHI